MTEATNGKIFVVNPMLGTVTEKDFIADGNRPEVQSLLQMVKEGKCETFTMASGDRLVAGKGSFDMSAEKADRLGASLFGQFAFLKEAPDLSKPEVMKNLISFTADSVDMIEVTGPAMIVGPAASEDDKSVTGTTLTEIDIASRVGFKGSSNKIADLVKRLRGLVADNDDRPWSDSVHDPDLVDYRKSLSDEELAECPCPGCKDEIARRAVEAGGSRAVN